MQGIVIVADRSSATNRSLAAAFRAAGLPAHRLGGAQLRAARLLGRLDGAVLLGRADVSRRLDGVGETFWELRRLERDGWPILNGTRTLLRCHDKLYTAKQLGRAGVRHPRTELLRDVDAAPSFAGPYVIKPRFGSWGRGVERCEDAAELRAALKQLARRRWFRRRGVIVQEHVANVGVDLRVVIARNEVIGAIERVAAPGEWRTNISLGATRRPLEAPPEARVLALAAAAALEADLVGVDLLPLPGGGFTVLEANGAVDFTDVYGEHVFERAAGALAQSAVPLLSPQPQLIPQLAPVQLEQATPP